MLYSRRLLLLLESEHCVDLIMLMILDYWEIYLHFMSFEVGNVCVSENIMTDPKQQHLNDLQPTSFQYCGENINIIKREILFFFYPELSSLLSHRILFKIPPTNFTSPSLLLGD